MTATPALSLPALPLTTDNVPIPEGGLKVVAMQTPTPRVSMEITLVDSIPLVATVMKTTVHVGNAGENLCVHSLVSPTYSVVFITLMFLTRIWWAHLTNFMEQSPS
jgi:hypothetical protein